VRTEGGAALYETTTQFLKHFQLRNIDDLPRAQELQRM
jgi:chromosome segregation and condensation protein ScpB